VQRRVFGGAKRGAAFGHAKIAFKSLLVCGLKVLAATVSTPPAPGAAAGWPKPPAPPARPAPVRADVAVAWVDLRIWCVQDARGALTDVSSAAAPHSSDRGKRVNYKGFDAETWSRAGESTPVFPVSIVLTALQFRSGEHTGNGWGDADVACRDLDQMSRACNSRPIRRCGPRGRWRS
jgi:hypothetical protein